MLEAFVAALVGTLSTRAAEGVADAASGAWSALVRLVRRRLGTDPGPAAALAAVEQAPDDQDRQAALVEQLRRALAQDARFADEFRSLWQQAQVSIHAEGGGVASQFSGTGTGLVQAGRDVTVNYLASLDAPPAVPRQVPALAGPFVNRLRELSDLDRPGDAGAPGGLVEASTPPDPPAGVKITMVVGMPGVGKSALVSRWAAAAGDRFPGGQLYVDFALLRGRTGAGAAVPEAMTSCLRALGVDERLMPTALAEQVNLFRTRTAGRPPTLVVLDGVNEPAQVDLLVPSAPGSAVVVATEYAFGQLVRDGAHMVELKPLTPEAAVSLLAAMCGQARITAEPDAAAAVAGWCGGLPEALRVAGARLVLDSTLGVADLAAELADEAGRLDALSLPGWASTGVDSTVAAAFAVSYGRLPATAREVYRDLGVMPVEDLGVDLVLAVVRADPTATRTALEALVAASLLERAGRGRYRLHQLVRLHAARQATVEEPHRGQEVVRRVVEFCLSRAAWADRAVMGDRLRRGGFDPTAGGRDGSGGDGGGMADPFAVPDRRLAGLMWLEAERANLLKVLRAAVDAGLDEPAWQLAQALNALYLNHRHHVDWIEATRLGATAARRHGRRDVEARLRSMVSRAYTDLADLRSARAEIEAAMRAIADIDDPELLASVWEFRGRYLEQVDRDEAVKAYHISISLNVQARQWRGVALVRYFLGCCLDEMRRGEEALPLLQQARTALRELGDERMAQRCGYSIGLAHLHQEHFAEAGRELRAAAEAFAAAQLWHYEVPAREALADLAQRTGDKATGRRELQRALHIEQTAGGLRVERLRARLAALA